MRTAKSIAIGILLGLAIAMPTVQAVKYYYAYQHVLDKYEVCMTQEISLLDMDE